MNNRYYDYDANYDDVKKLAYKRAGQHIELVALSRGVERELEATIGHGFEV